MEWTRYESIPIALIQYVFKQGRNGKGSIYVWANGNGGEYDDCAADGYASSIYTISVGGIELSGNATNFDEQCSAKLVVAYSTNIVRGKKIIVFCIYISLSAAEDIDHR